MVEDEELEREALAHTLARMSDVETCLTASHAEEALGLLGEMQPDVAVIDIRLPRKNGLELAREIREHVPWCQVVFLTAYSRIDYLKQAIAVGAAAYLLKPVTEGELRTAVSRAGHQALEARAAIKQEKDFTKVRPFLESGLAYELLGGWVSPTEARSRLSMLGKDCLPNCVLALHVETPQTTKPERGDREDQGLRDQISALLQMQTRMEPDSLLALRSHPYYLLLQSDDESLERTVALGHRLAEVIHRETGARVGVGIGQIRGLRDLGLSCIEALSAVRPLGPLDSEAEGPGRARSSVLGRTPAGSETRHEMPEEISFKLLLTNVNRQEADHSLPANHQVVRTLKEWVGDHLDGPFGLEQASEAVGLTPSYVSKLFKKLTGTGFSTYVNSLRISRAQDLLRRSSLGVAAIAHRCGYQSHNYFCSVFRRLAHETPTQYRRRHWPDEGRAKPTSVRCAG